MPPDRRTPALFGSSIPRACRQHAPVNPIVAKRSDGSDLCLEDRLSLIAECSPDWESWFSPEGKYLWVSPAVEKMTGYTCAEVLAIPDFLGALIAPDDVEAVRGHFLRALRGESGQDIEFKCVRKDGSQFWVSGSWQMVFDAEGRPLGVRTSKRDISRRKTMEESCAEKSRLLSVAARIGRIVGWVIEEDGRTFHLSEEAKTLLGIKPEAPMTVDAILEGIVSSAEERARIAAAVDEAFSSGTPLDMEVELVSDEGQKLWSRMAGEVVRQNGRIRRIEGIFQDISEQAKALEEMRKFRQLIDGLQDYIYFKDREHRFTLVNAYCLQVGGLSSQYQLAGLTDHDLEDKETADQHRALEEEIFRTGKPMVNVEELQRFKHTGLERWHSTTKLPYRNLKGEIVGLMGLSREITDLKRREKHLGEMNRELQRLHQSENIQRLIAANLAGGIGIWECNLETNELICDAMACRLHGAPEGALKSVQEWALCLGEDERERLLGEIALLARGDRDEVDTDYWVQRSDGSRVCLRALGCKQADARGAKIIGTFWEITREKTAQQEIERAAKLARIASEAKSTFLANISHEIRTPLNAIIGISELLLQNPSSSEMPEMLRTIQHSGNMLLSLISGVLDLSKIEAGTLDLHNAPFPLRTCLEDALDIVKNSTALAADLRVNFSADFPSSLVGDKDRLNQVVINLLNNAAKFTPSGTITLSGSLQENRVMISVTDTGIGISPEDQKRLFRSFTQVDSSLSRLHSGAGLGLAISKKLVELMGGTLEVESAVGRGSTFRILLPLQISHHSADDSRSPEAPSPLRPLKILIVEDNPVNLRVVTLLVERLGMRPRGVTGGREALEILSAESFDVILMDMQMPEMDGLEVTRQIRARLPRSRVPCIIALTANATVEDRRKCLEAGMDDFLTKPIKSDQLAAALRQAAKGV